MIQGRQRYTYQEHERTFLHEIERGQRSSLPLNCYIALAFKQVAGGNLASHAADDNSSTSEVPPIFEFVRYLKAHPELCALGADDALERVTRSMLEIRLHWRPLCEGSAEEAEIAFVDFWERVRHPVGWTPLGEAARRASISQVKLLKPRNALFVRFISVAVHLQKIVGKDEHTFLPCREVAVVLTCAHETVWRMRGFATRDGLIRQLTKGRYSGVPGSGEASEFIVRLERFDSELRQVR